MEDMIEAALEEIGDVVIIEAVEDRAALFAGANQAHLAEGAELVGGGRLADPDLSGEGADIDLAFKEGGDHPNSGGVAEGTEELGHLGSGLVIEQRGSQQIVHFVIPE